MFLAQRIFRESVFSLLLILVRPQVVMAGLTGALALLAIGGVVQASPFPANGTITQPATLPTTVPSSTTASGNLTCGTIEVSVLQAVAVAAYSGLSTDPALECQCIGSVNSWLRATDAPTRTLTRTIGTGVTTFTESLSSTTTVITTVLDLTSVITATDNVIEPDTNLWYGSATSPCCYSCTIQASTVEVFFWTDATESPAITSFSSNGVVYESPSIYIGFSSLSAFDYCGLVGSAYTNTTMAFNPTELSTLLFSEVIGTSQVFTVVSGGTTSFSTEPPGTLFTPDGSALLNTKDLERNCSTVSGYTYIPGNPSNAGIHITPPDPCHPTIVIPDRVRSLQPGWGACLSDAIGGFYDPPSALSPVSELVPTSALPPPASTTPSPPRRTNPLPGSTAGRGNNGPQPSSSPGSSNDKPPPPPTGDNNNVGGASTAAGGTSENASPSQTPSQNGGAANSSPASQQTGSAGQPPSSVIVIGSATFSENSKSEFVFGSTTLTPGGAPLTLGGTTLSLPAPESSASGTGSGAESSATHETGSNATGTGSAAAGETGSSETVSGAQGTSASNSGSQETSAINSGTSAGGDAGLTSTASTGLPSTSASGVPKSEAASGLILAAMRNVKVVGVVMLVALCM
ncbi:hypothetical protein ACQKWADRAFT_277416 [Trichoderma austrokoningii]